MKIGLGTYAYFWRLSDKVSSPMTLTGALEDSAAIGAQVFQICDYPRIESWSSGQLAELRHCAERLGLELELGTKGIVPAHLRRYLEIAQELRCTIVRSMVTDAINRPTTAQACQHLETVVPEFEGKNISICLETYEQVPTRENIKILEHFKSPNLGICLDPANIVAALETPDDVVKMCDPWVLNWHIKDAKFSRRDGWVGFSYSGCPLGEGILNYDTIFKTIRPHERNINQIIEHWLPWQEDEKSTCQIEDSWTREAMKYLLDYKP